jgi:glycosyltransferase involved in cell wall biosynthesis
MRILQLVSGRTLNGAIRHCLDLAIGLHRRGHHVAIGHRPDAWIGQQAKKHALPTLELDFSRWPPRRFLAEVNLVRDGQFDLLHSHQSRSHFFGVLCKWATGIPSIATAHSRFLQPHWRFNSHVLTSNQATAHYHRRYNLVPRSRLTVVPNWVGDDALIPSDPATRLTFRESLQLDGQQPVIGVIGNVEPRKGMDVLVEALPALVANHPRLVVLSAGALDGPFVQRIQSRADGLGVASHLRLLGQRSDIAQLLDAIDLFVLPSREEQLPLSILEAMARHRAVVATRVGGIPECIVDGQHGRIVPAGQPEPLAAAIDELLRNPQYRTQMGHQAAQRIAQDFSPQHCIGQIESVYAAVLGKGLRSRAA